MNCKTKLQGDKLIEKRGYTHLSIDIFSQIEKAIRERNHFWWGCYVGIGYGARVESVRIDKDGKLTASGFEPIAIVEYGSPYDGGRDGKFIKWCSKSIEK